MVEHEGHEHPRTAPDPDGPAAVRLRGASVVRGSRTVWEHGDIAIPRGSIVGRHRAERLRARRRSSRSLLGLLPVDHRPRRGARQPAPSRRPPHRLRAPELHRAPIGDAIRCRDLVALGLTGTRWGLGPARADDRDARSTPRSRPSAALRVRRPPHVAPVGRPAATGRHRPGPRRRSPSCCCSTSRWPTSTCATSTRSSSCSSASAPTRDITVHGGRPRPQPAAVGPHRRRLPARRPPPLRRDRRGGRRASCSPTSTAPASRWSHTPQGDLFTRSGR